MIDLHSHILPGIDDGAAMMQDSIRLVKELESIGVSDIFATPHYVDETIYVSPRKDNLKLIDELQREIDKEGISVRLHLGNEVYKIFHKLEYLYQVYSLVTQVMQLLSLLH